MQYILQCNHIQQIYKFIDYKKISGFIIGEKFLSLDCRIKFNFDELKKVILFLKEKNKKVLIDCKKIIHSKDIEYLKKFLLYINNLEVDYILYTDHSVYNIITTLNINQKLLFANDIFNTHFQNILFLNSINVNNSSLSRELTREEIESILFKKTSYPKIKLEYQIFGHLRMFNSKRKLINNYFNFINSKKNSSKHSFKLYDKERKSFYPIFEDINGTHIFSFKNTCLLDELDVLNKVDFLTINLFNVYDVADEIIVNNFIYIKELFINNKNEYNIKKKYIYKKLERDLIKFNIYLDKGFFYKPTIY